MYKPHTIQQFKVQEFLKERFEADACFIAPISRHGLMLQDMAGGRIAFEYRDGDIQECPVPEPGSSYDRLVFMQALQYHYPRTEQQTYAAKTALWLEASVGLTHQQALDLPDDLYLRYLTHTVPNEENVRRMAASGMISGEDYQGILLWYLDGHFGGNYLGAGGVDGFGIYIDLIFCYHTPQAQHYQFYLKDTAYD